MKGLLVRFFLSLCIFLLSGYSPLSARSYQEDIVFKTVVESLQAPTSANPGSIEHPQTFIDKTSSSRAQSQSIKLDFAENEIEEDELLSARKHAGSSYYMAIALCALVLGYLFSCIKQSLVSSGHYSYITSYRWYIVFSVFRI